MPVKQINILYNILKDMFVERKYSIVQMSKWKLNG